MKLRRTLVVCIGNRLVADDAVGCHIYDRLTESAPPEGMRIEHLALGGLDLLDKFGNEDLLIVVDAVRLGGGPGTIHIVDWRDLPVAQGAPVTSHDVGVREAIAIGRRLIPENVPERVLLVGVEGREFDVIGAPLSPEVEAAVGGATAEVMALAGSRTLRDLLPTAG